MHFKHYENPYSGLAQYVNCAAANPGADAGMYDALEQYKLSTLLISASPEYSDYNDYNVYNNYNDYRESDPFALSISDPACAGL